MIKAVIFDLDGVIVDTAHYHYLAWKKLAHELGIALTPEDNEKLKGVSRMQSLDIILALGGVSLSDQDKVRLAHIKNTWFVDFIERMEPEAIFPGVRSLLEALRMQGIKTGLASSSKNAVTVLDLLRIRPLFDAIVDGNMVVHAKPDPEVFLQTASLLNVPPAECVVFEDAEAGVEAALRAGMKCIGVGLPAQLGKANLVIARTSDFHPEMLNTFK